MPFNAGGSTTRTTKTSGGTTWASDAAASNPINATEFDTEAADIYSMLAKCITNDGNQTVTADIPWNAKKITNLADPVSNQDAATKNYVSTNYFLKSGGTISGNVTVSSGGITVTGNSTITGTLGGLTGLTVASGGATITAGGLTVTAGGLAVTAGGATVGGSVTLTPAAGRGLTVNGVSGTHSTQIADSATNLFDAGYLGLPISANTTLALSDRGKSIQATGTITVPNAVFAAGDTVMVYNNSAGSITLTATITTMRLAGTTTTGSRTIAARGWGMIYFVSGTECVVGGSGVS